jgi:hypothetical protein
MKACYKFGGVGTKEPEKVVIGDFCTRHTLLATWFRSFLYAPRQKNNK